MHKQLPGLKDQRGLVNFQLGEVSKLEAEAPKTAAGSPFPVVMSATVVGLSLAEARALLEKCLALLNGEIEFYEAFDRQIEQLQGKGEDETAKAEIDTLTKNAAAREAITAGTAAYCMQAVAAASVFMLKGLEKARSYRA